MRTTLPRSTDLEHFLLDLEAPVTSRTAMESLDLDALRRLTDKDRKAAEQQLIEHLADANDPRVPDALRHIRSWRAVEPLRAALPKATGPRVRLAIGAALSALGEADGAQVVAAVMTQGQWPMDRSAAAHVAGELTDPSLQAALLVALADPDRAVRLSAGAALLHRRGLDELAGDFRHPLGMLQLRLGSPLIAVHKPAAAELQRILEALDRGEPAGLGVRVAEECTWASRLLDSIESEAEELDVDLIGTLRGEARTWAEHALLTGLPEPRAVRDLGRIGAVASVPALRELLAQVQAPQQKEISDTLKRLEHPP